MTPEQKLALLVRLGERFNDQGWDGVVAFVHPEIEFQEPPEQPGATVFRGLDEVREGWARWADTWMQQESEPQGFELLPDGRILTFSRERMLGRDGVRVETDSAQVFTFRDGKIVRWQVFWDAANARAATGL